VIAAIGASAPIRTRASRISTTMILGSAFVVGGGGNDSAAAGGASTTTDAKPGASLVSAAARASHRHL